MKPTNGASERMGGWPIPVSQPQLKLLGVYSLSLGALEVRCVLEKLVSPLRIPGFLTFAKTQPLTMRTSAK